MMFTLEKVIQAWNDRADWYNHWESLGDDEKFDFISEKYKARIKELEDGIRRLKATTNADWSLSNSRLMSHVDACEHLFKLIENWSK